MDRLAAVLEKLAKDDKLDKAIGVLEAAASKPSSLGTSLLCLFFTYYAMLQCSNF